MLYDQTSFLAGHVQKIFFYFKGNKENSFKIKIKHKEVQQKTIMFNSPAYGAIPTIVGISPR